MYFRSFSLSIITVTLLCVHVAVTREIPGLITSLDVQDSDVAVKQLARSRRDVIGTVIGGPVGVVSPLLPIVIEPISNVTGDVVGVVSNVTGDAVVVVSTVTGDAVDAASNVTGVVTGPVGVVPPLLPIVFEPISNVTLDVVGEVSNVTGDAVVGVVSNITGDVLGIAGGLL